MPDSTTPTAFDPRSLARDFSRRSADGLGAAW
ncbi:hypothetical protein RB2654_15020 [Rhodobacterales bacterium HTCC2654]|uniref:Uncharacterized protein n=1 Tax=Maritimibacter alkaliphilus HTCC2654 TaxID=314271 RepID=A3VH53_9RHOB|nr:hypothetical protein RB2654_15020 [Rhodobacterales bacterium HTCC2654] [Maritimibacter alkaliphilus HTCC2654]